MSASRADGGVTTRITCNTVHSVAASWQSFCCDT
jgi:hypothetical protein